MAGGEQMYSEVVDNKRREVANRRAQINWWRYTQLKESAIIIKC